ncbi:MAG: hypothetical protein A3J70_14315 [Elusimicrobia bacterium RIFCSPHIGHO2_02_FULL_61_10]|nr:MAG: hypothetical protein A3I76_02525 [Elusimicrobia bacterium RIFCSPLOWO2_02_FULL_61_11]OGS26171.1 MAG: hypothetical protein A3J70_14315 [Elusimicrobia bacterium RIFCSPHIGHO2_02_FULL_61_10]
MAKKELLWNLLIKAVKTLVALFTLVAIGTFVEYLPYAKALPFLSQKLPVGVFLNAVVSLLGLVVFVKFGAEASPAADGILEFVPGAGKLFRSIVKILALLFAYYAFQDAVFPFIADYEWAYQTVFLGFTLFFLVRAGLQIYESSEEISKFLVSGLRPDKPSVHPENKALDTK